MDLFKTFGHFHVVLLHLPIGLIAGVGVLEALTLRGDRGGEGQAAGAVRAATRVLLWLLAASAVCAASTGYVLSFQGYIGSTLQLHMWLGIGVAAMSVFTLIVHEYVLRALLRGKRAGRGIALYRLGLVCTIGLIVPAGHLGGTLTHGDDFLFGAARPAPEAKTESGTVPLATSEFDLKVAPVLQANCYGCHGEGKQKGGLALHTEQGISAGGKHGAVVVAGNAGSSELVRRMRLPLDAKGHMPPKEKRQPEEEQVRAIEHWIQEGASFSDRANSREQGIHGGPAERDVRVERTRAGEREPGLSSADGGAVAALREALVHVQAVGPGSPLLWVDFAAPAGAGLVNDDRVAELLGPIVSNIQDLSLARSGVTDRSAALIAGMTELRKLDLSRTAITDEGLARIGHLKKIEEINLIGTGIGDGAVESLAGMRSVKRVYVWGTKLTAGGVGRLQSVRADMSIETGLALTGRVLEQEGVPALVRSKPQVSAEKAGEVEIGPKNAVCPVTDKPVDRRYVIIYEGKQIGFCCPDCAKKFWEHPAAYLEAAGR